jgi:integrase/recombinase XerD
MTTLRESLEDYLALRRSVGYKLEDVARILAGFVAFAERAGAGTITTELALVRSSKFGRSREVVCHVSTVEALRAYSARRDQLCPRPAPASFFVSARGRRLAHHSVYATFHKLAGDAGLRQRPGGRPPRVHDLRHSFAAGTLLRWYRDGDDVQARLPLLSAYLGHVRPSSTFWYLTASPDLLALAAERLEASGEEQQR